MHLFPPAPTADVEVVDPAQPPATGPGTDALVWLVRHGSVRSSGIAYGDLDVRLSDKGLEETRAAVESLAPLGPRFVLSSPLSRAKEMGTALAQAVEAELVVDVRCAELNRGDWQGLPLEEYGARWGAAAGDYWRAPLDWNGHGGESERELRARVHAAVSEWLEARGQGSAVPLVVTSHRQALRALVGACLGLPAGASHSLQIDCGAGVLLRDRPDGWVLERTNVRPPGARHAAQPDGIEPRDVF